MGFKGVYKAPIGTTMRVASSLDEGQTFQLRRTPSRSSCAWIEDMSMVARRAARLLDLGLEWVDSRCGFVRSAAQGLWRSRDSTPADSTPACCTAAETRGTPIRWPTRKKVARLTPYLRCIRYLPIPHLTPAAP